MSSILNNFILHSNLFRYFITHIFLIHSKTLQFPYFPYEDCIETKYFHCFIYDKLQIHKNYTWDFTNNSFLKTFTFPIPNYIPKEKNISIFSMTSKLLRAVNFLLNFHDTTITYNDFYIYLNKFIFSDE